MQRRYSLAHLILAIVAGLVLTSLMVAVDAQAQIAFVSNRDGNWEIYVMNTDGGNQRNLTNNPAADLAPSWSPDGKRIAFQSDRGGPVNVRVPIPGIYVMDADGNNPQRLTNNGNNDRDPSWSPDGKRIAFVSGRQRDFENAAITYEIYVMDADGGNQQRLTNNDRNDYSPSWSPDGKRITFSSEMPGNAEIYVMDADGGNQQRLTNNGNSNFAPSWSPDGKRIAFVSVRWADFVHNFEIYVVDTDGGNQRRLTNSPRHDGVPSWSPDGKWITFVSERDGNAEIYVMDADGANPQNVTNNPSYDSGPAWLDFPFSVSPAGKKFTMWGWLKLDER